MYITTSYNLCSIYTHSTEKFKIILFLCTRVYSHVSWIGAPSGIVVHLVMEYLLYNYIRDTYFSILHNVISWSLKSLFQLDHDVDISFYRMEAIGIYHYRELLLIIFLLFISKMKISSNTLHLGLSLLYNTTHDQGL